MLLARVRSLLINRYNCLIAAFISVSVFAQQPATVDEVVALIGKEQYQQATARIDQLLPSTGVGFERARLLQLKADALYYLNQIDQSLQFYLESIQAFEEAGAIDNLSYHEAVSHAGFCYRMLGQYPRALFYYQRSISIVAGLGDSLEVAASHSNMGSTYAKMGNLDSAVAHFKAAYQIDLLLKDTAAIGFDLRNLAEMQLENGDYEDAVRSLRRSLQLLQVSSGNANSHALRLLLMGKAFVGLKLYDSASRYFISADRELQALGDSLSLSLNWLAMSGMEAQRKNFPLALKYAKMSQYYISNLPAESAHKIAIRNAMVTVHLEQGDTDVALRLINENLAAADDLGLVNVKRDALLKRALLYERQREFAKALQDFKVLNDTILNRAAQQQLVELTVKYDVDNLNQRNEILELENKLARTENEQKDARIRWIVAGSTLFIMITIAVAWMYYSRQRLKNQLLSEEIHNLRNQIKLAVEGDISSIQFDLKAINKKLETPLSDRELEILQLALSDMSNSQIGEKVFVSVNTVKFHLKNIYDKIGVASRKEALQFALKTQGAELPPN